MLKIKRSCINKVKYNGWDVVRSVFLQNSVYALFEKDSVVEKVDRLRQKGGCGLVAGADMKSFSKLVLRRAKSGYSLAGFAFNDFAHRCLEPKITRKTGFGTRTFPLSRMINRDDDGAVYLFISPFGNIRAFKNTRAKAVNDYGEVYFPISPHIVDVRVVK